jgi:hypothetical protein
MFTQNWRIIIARAIAQSNLEKYMDCFLLCFVPRNSSQSQ